MKTGHGIHAVLRYLFPYFHNNTLNLSIIFLNFALLFYHPPSTLFHKLPTPAGSQP